MFSYPGTFNQWHGIATVEKRFDTFFKHRLYGRTKIFLPFIKYPEKIRSQDFLAEVNETIVRLPSDNILLLAEKQDAGDGLLQNFDWDY